MDEFDKEENKTALKRSGGCRWFFIHAFFLITWTPLAWAISGDVIEAYVIGWKYQQLFMWGCGSSTFLFNLAGMFKHLRKWDDGRML